jgi:parallel beta-helix repeat protein
MGHGIYMTTSNNIIRGNTFYEVGNYSIHQWTALPKYANNNIIEGNIITGSGHDKTRYGHVCCGGITVSAGTGTVIRNNIVYGNEVNGIEVNPNCTNCKVYNNTTYNNPGWNIYAFDGGSGIEVRNNIAYPKGIYLGTGSSSSNNLTTNPNFINAAGNDFRLLSSSPAIDTGMTLSSVTVDFARSVRPHGSAYDIGAYEFGGTSGSTLSAPRNLRVQ